MLKQLRLYIKGDVIGVGFRAWTKIQAKINNVTGWVRNNHERSDIFGVNGGVEVVIQADDKKIEKILSILKKGPPVSRVEDIEVFFEEPKEIFETFEIKR
jgi:acylphosphatase